jgi:hypothetical protein
MKRFSVSPVVVFLLACCATIVSRAQDAAPVPIDDSEAYAVYASLLPREWVVTAAHAKRLVFQREADAYLRCMPRGPSLETDWKTTVDSYRAANAGVRYVREGFPLLLPYVVVSRADIEAAFRDDSITTARGFGWDGFYQHYPDSGGYLMVSAVGFNAEKTRAMVYIGHSCGSLCGGGTHHLLEKADGAWQEVRPRDVQFCMWAS